eukprot:gene7052-8984_t
MLLLAFLFAAYMILDLSKMTFVPLGTVGKKFAAVAESDKLPIENARKVGDSEGHTDGTGTGAGYEMVNTKNVEEIGSGL